MKSHEMHEIREKLQRLQPGNDLSEIRCIRICRGAFTNSDKLAEALGTG